MAPLCGRMPRWAGLRHHHVEAGAAWSRRERRCQKVELTPNHLCPPRFSPKPACSQAATKGDSAMQRLPAAAADAAAAGPQQWAALAGAQTQALAALAGE